MQMKRFTESEIETFAVDELIKLGFYYTPGPSIAPDNETTDEASMISDHRTTYNEPEKRKNYEVVILKGKTIPPVPLHFQWSGVFHSVEMGGHIGPPLRGKTIPHAPLHFQWSWISDSVGADLRVCPDREKFPMPRCISNDHGFPIP